MAGKQPLKKKEVPAFSVKDFKKNYLGEKVGKIADKELEWVIMPKAFQEATRLPGFPLGRATVIRGWTNTGKSTLKNLAIAAAMRQGMLPVIFETEGNFDFQYAKDCGMDITPVYGPDPETGEETIVDWEGDYILFTGSKICEFCGDMDYSKGEKVKTKRNVPVIEDLGYIINTFLDEQHEGNIPMPILFIWDSIGTIESWKSYSSKSTNNMWDAGAIKTTFKHIFSRIAASKEVGAPYTNGMIAINQIWKDNQNSMGGATAIANSGGEAFKYGCRLGIHCGGVATQGTKKLKATVKGAETEYGTVTKISVYKNQLPIPYNITYNGTVCCVHNGMITEDDIADYKKTELPRILEMVRDLNGEGGEKINAEDIKFSEIGKVSDEVVPIE